ncbi:MAG: amidohydrolase family protein [Verrucomicrobiota bacterium]|jgi:cytosine/adenosine deaminase-related metal-dependent hydrolase
MILRARVVAPVSQPPIENGAAIIFRNRIRAVGAWRDLRPRATGETVDLGEVILLPGLVNAHCHLDYTDMAGLLAPTKTFTDWIHLMISAKAQWGYAEYARSWLNGARMLLQTGTTTAADIETVPDLLPEVWNATPLRIFSFLEMTGIRARREPRAVLREAVEKIESLTHPRCCASLSPHAPYSTLPELLRLSARAARNKRLPITTHVAESAQEFEMFVHARGAMHAWLKQNERDMTDCGLGSPVEHLARNGILAKNLLAVHANYLGRRDAALLARRNVSVVHCPRSHFYFKHHSFPLGRLLKAGVNVCLGTDSLATVYKTRREEPELSLFEEMRVLAAGHPGLSPNKILRMATVNGAKALGLAGRIGELSRNAFADLVAIPFAGKRSGAAEAIINFSEHVRASMIDGQWATAPD